MSGDKSMDMHVAKIMHKYVRSNEDLGKYYI